MTGKEWLLPCHFLIGRGMEHIFEETPHSAIIHTWLLAGAWTEFRSSQPYIDICSPYFLSMAMFWINKLLGEYSMLYTVLLCSFSFYLLYSRIPIQAQAIKEDIGYPAYIKNDTKLDAQYSMVSNTVFYVYLYATSLRMTTSANFWYRYFN